ncbi:unnamed protein product [Effrenium voratum]|nr:unnamed protein product [Effrenium voratum]
MYCWAGLCRLLRAPVHFFREEEELPDLETRCLHYEDRREAVAEIALEGGEGDAVCFQRVRPGSRAELAGVQVGDEVLQVNLVDPKILFWRPAEEILPAIVGPVMLRWRKRAPQKLGERTRINSKGPQLRWHDDEEFVEVSEYPKSRAVALGHGEWRCGSCDATNFDSQEHCRRCGLRDSRLPQRPGKVPLWDTQKRTTVSFGSLEVSKEDVKAAMRCTELPEVRQEAKTIRLLK